MTTTVFHSSIVTSMVTSIVAPIVAPIVASTGAALGRPRGPCLAPSPFTALGLALSVWLASAPALGAQADDAPSSLAYLHLITEHFDLPPGEAALLLEEGIEAEELPVLLLLARGSGLSPAAVLLRRVPGGAGWTEVARQVGLNPVAFHVEVPDAELDARGRRAVEAFRSAPRDGWAHLRLRDADIVTLANLKFLTSSLGAEPVEVFAARERAGSWVRAVDRLSGAADRDPGS